MKIISIDETRLIEVVQYVSRVSGEDYNKVFEKYKKRIDRKTDEVLVCIENNKIIGVASICTDIEGKYVELTDNIHTDEKFESISMYFFGYLKERFSGYHFDAVYKEKNKQGAAFMANIGAKCVFREIEMKLTKEDYKPLAIKKAVIPLCDKYFKAFCEIHDGEHQDVYWTGERIINDLDKFEILLAIDNEKVIGSIVSSSYEKNKKYIYFLEVDENYRRQGYARSLLEKSIETAFEYSSLAEISLCAEVSNEAGKKLYQSVGFKVISGSNTYSIEQL